MLVDEPAVGLVEPVDELVDRADQGNTLVEGDLVVPGQEVPEGNAFVATAGTCAGAVGESKYVMGLRAPSTGDGFPTKASYTGSSPP